MRRQMTGGSAGGALQVQAGSCAAGGCGVDGGVMWQNHPMGMPGSPGLDSSIPQAWQQVDIQTPPTCAGHELNPLSKHPPR
jgi:hypothetical protein